MRAFNYKSWIIIPTLKRLHRASILVLFSVAAIHGLQGQATLTLQKQASNTTPQPGELFYYIIDAACNSTTNDCESTVIVDCLDPDVDFLNVSNPLPDGVSSAVYDPTTHCITIEFDATQCNTCSPDGINTDNDDFAQGSSIQLSIQVMFPLGTFDGTTSENTADATTDNAGNPSATASVVTATGGASDEEGCAAMPSYAAIPGDIIPGGT